MVLGVDGPLCGSPLCGFDIEVRCRARYILGTRARHVSAERDGYFGRVVTGTCMHEALSTFLVWMAPIRLPKGQ